MAHVLPWVLADPAPYELVGAGSAGVIADANPGWREGFTTMSTNMTTILDPRSLAWALYWDSDELRRDFAILAYGRLQELYRSEGKADTPAQFFFEAARSYAGQYDDLGKIAHRACVSVAMSFEEGRPQ